MNSASAIKERVLAVGSYIVDNKATIRQAASIVGTSKSTASYDINNRLVTFDPKLYKRVRKVIEKNKAERHLRGGKATKAYWKTVIKITKRKAKKGRVRTHNRKRSTDVA